jgi:cytochrome c oxidase assembly protein subunit 15
VLRISPQRYVWVARIALLMLVAIVITGSIVRLTGSGLGCVDWPACNEERFVDVSSGHAAIEQVNRLFTGLVALAVILALGTSALMRPRSRRLVLLSVGLVVGVLAQVVIGGIVVLTGLHPSSNMAHFLVSVVLVATARTLMWEARVHAGMVNPSGNDQAQMVWGVILYVAVLATIVAGTIVTASGPHAGDENAPRFGFELSDVVRVHGVFAWLTGILMLIGIRRSLNEWRSQRRQIEVLLGVMLAQIFVGYLQYFSGVPSQLVAIHIAVSMIIVIAATDVLWTATRKRQVIVQPPATADL